MKSRGLQSWPLASGGDFLRDALGHSSLAVTDRDLRDVAPVHVIETMRARKWSLE
ncbi:MAG: hypothetical protein ABW135_03390 [Thermoleophilaceae bacterium]